MKPTQDSRSGSDVAWHYNPRVELHMIKDRSIDNKTSIIWHEFIIASKENSM